MLYRILRWLGRMALRWFYREVDVAGLERVPQGVPLLIASNHPNQLIDALLVGCSIPRTVTFTGKAILLDNPAMRVVMSRLPFVPLRRVADERKRDPGAAVDRSRNADSFRAILDALEQRQAVLIFPEGISHDEPEMSLLKTGVARIALQARDDRAIRGLHILPVGLTYERKWAARTRALVLIGEPIAIDDWRPPQGGESEGAAVQALTAEVNARLRAVTLNFPTREAAERVITVSSVLSGVYDNDELRPLRRPDTPLATAVDVARRVEAVRRTLDAGEAAPEVAVRVERFQARLDAFRDELARHDVAANDVGMEVGAADGARFTLRETALLALGGPLALWGRVNHWLPLALARTLARRTSETPQDPAMHTVVAGLGATLAWYVVATAVVAWLAGPWWALAYLVSLPIAGTWYLQYADRLRRARRRVRTYLLFRRDPALRQRLLDDVAWLRTEAETIEGAMARRRSMQAAALR
ncbi:MAG TPA: lysophospholipid acyltransferase family protein [Gemmatimonadaceae bacterium]|nr:lysophospholipid acyltransferase family protein [Gemmatimonadaceae bacterium]